MQYSFAARTRDLISKGALKARFPGLFQAYVRARDIFSLRDYQRRGSYSQHGEDRFILEFFENRKQGTFLDIGASHPFRISNTYLLYQNGWRGVCVDPIPYFEGLYRRWRPEDVFVNTGVGAKNGKLRYFELVPSVLSTFDEKLMRELVNVNRATLARTYDVEVVGINDLLASRFGCAPDFLSIDVEGLDLEILAAIDFERYRPRLICVEYNIEPVKNGMLKILKAAQYRIEVINKANIIASDPRVS